MTDRDGQGDPESRDLAPDVYDAMEPLEPYTAVELAKRLRASTDRVRERLRSLVDDDRVRKKEPEPEVVIRIREPPTHARSECGYGFQVGFLRPVPSSVGLCPQCGPGSSDGESARGRLRPTAARTTA